METLTPSPSKNPARAVFVSGNIAHSMLLFPVVDRLLGDSGGPSDLSREVTEIEDHIAKDSVRLARQELPKGSDPK